MTPAVCVLWLPAESANPLPAIRHRFSTNLQAESDGSGRLAPKDTLRRGKSVSVVRSQSSGHATQSRQFML